MYRIDLDEFEKEVKLLMKNEFGSVEEAVKTPIFISQRIRDKAVSILRKKYGYLVSSNPNDQKIFTKEVQVAYETVVNKIISENK